MSNGFPSLQTILHHPKMHFNKHVCCEALLVWVKVLVVCVEVLQTFDEIAVFTWSKVSKPQALATHEGGGAHRCSPGFSTIYSEFGKNKTVLSKE